MEVCGGKGGTNCPESFASDITVPLSLNQQHRLQTSHNQQQPRASRPTHHHCSLFSSRSPDSPYLPYSLHHRPNKPWPVRNSKEKKHRTNPLHHRPNLPPPQWRWRAPLRQLLLYRSLQIEKKIPNKKEWKWFQLRLRKEWNRSFLGFGEWMLWDDVEFEGTKGEWRLGFFAGQRRRLMLFILILFYHLFCFSNLFLLISF